jgi:UDP:flavonoid glycosyltransferase YjiC (YdhE family)
MASADPRRGKPRILFMAEAVTLAHVVRPLALAQRLDAARYDVHFAVADNDLMQGKDFIFTSRTLHRHLLESMPSTRFLRAIRTGSRLYDRATLERYVDSDLDVLRALQPDVVVGDLRLSLATSARLTGTPYVAITNAYWSPALPAARMPRPDFARGPRLVRALGNRAARLALPLGLRWHARPLNQVRRSHGLDARGEFRAAYTDADQVLYADHASLVPLPELPRHHHYLGPIPWSPPQTLPTWWEQVPPGPPVVYVALGSSGASAALPIILDDLSRLMVTVLVAGDDPAAGGAPRGGIDAARRFSAPYLPGELAARRSRLVVCNGGSGSVYQALSAGVPVLGIAANMDQLLMMSHVERAGCGMLLRAGDLRPGAVLAAARRLLEEPAYLDAAQGMARSLATDDAHASFAGHLQSILSSSTAPVRSCLVHGTAAAASPAPLTTS